MNEEWLGCSCCHASSSAHVGDELARAVFFCPTTPPEPPADRPATRKLRHPTVAAHIMTATQPTGRNSRKHVDKLIFHINNDGNHIKYHIFIQTWRISLHSNELRSASSRQHRYIIPGLNGRPPIDLCSSCPAARSPDCREPRRYMLQRKGRLASPLPN